MPLWWIVWRYFRTGDNGGYYREIVGEIHDEYDDEERTYVVLNDHTWIFEAKTQLTDFYKIAKVDEDEFEKVVGDADTLAGMLLEIKGEFRHCMRR